ncbi:GNAT family N-acetyltransferase [Paenibacillus sp. GCM10023248]|uniref:GNAT family N-acetyltransferase n=1 Tax=Bacillales TaxID=1385 RepID=UPI0023795BB0|nr:MULTISPECIES: GNAT family N-acetyltransferase [Bacillales]MDD9269617.1 GNAT family N-acetyltransferase [Paenibacillus sp. MAHUQ-63]MDR6880748.1 ribosomal protein S18 acetylase RimI-like enzyme [Bacillus sp. 3255]
MGENGAIKILASMSENDLEWLKEQWLQWGDGTMITKGKKHHIQDLDAFIAWVDDIRVGAAPYRLGIDDCELMSINATVQGIGVGSKLLSTVEQTVKQSGRNRIWLITTNDNVDALKFYQRRGYRIKTINQNAVDEARKLKPAIPKVGYYDIPIHDEIELEKIL